MPVTPLQAGRLKNELDAKLQVERRLRLAVQRMSAQADLLLRKLSTLPGQNMLVRGPHMLEIVFLERGFDSLCLPDNVKQLLLAFLYGSFELAVGTCEVHLGELCGFASQLSMHEARLKQMESSVRFQGIPQNEFCFLCGMPHDSLGIPLKQEHLKVSQCQTGFTVQLISQAAKMTDNEGQRKIYWCKKNRRVEMVRLLDAGVVAQ